jgi:peptidyl-prolyl cis-trans isomerase-like protein 2
MYGCVVCSFFTFSSCHHLDNKHTVFGRIVGGMEVLDAMEQIKTFGKNKTSKSPDAPIQEIKITSTTIFTNPFDEPFTPVDELTQKTVQPKEETVEEERGTW